MSPTLAAMCQSFSVAMADMAQNISFNFSSDT